MKTKTVAFLILLCLCLGGCDFRQKVYNATESILNYISPLSYCLHCGDKWNWKESKSTYYEDTRDMFPLCKECFEKMTYPYVLWYHLRLFEKWKRQPTDEQIERLSFEISRQKNDTMWTVSWIKEKMYKNGRLISIYEIEN